MKNEMYALRPFEKSVAVFCSSLLLLFATIPEASFANSSSVDTIPQSSVSSPSEEESKMGPRFIEVMVDQSVADMVSRNEPVEVLILLDDTAEKTLEVSKHKGKELFSISASEYHERMQQRKSEIHKLRNSFKSEVEDAELKILTDYSVLPIVHARIHSERALKRLYKHNKVLSIDENIRDTTFMTQSLPLIGRTNPSTLTQTGSGATIAVLDTGVDYTLPAFGACSAPGGACKVVYAEDIAPSDDRLDDVNGHGTNVAAIALGVAPGAKIAALDVFSIDGGAYIDDQIAAINWCVLNKAKYNIVSINMSLGGPPYYSIPEAPTTARGAAIQKAVDAGILVAAASGNDACINAIAKPAAYTNVVSVGAIYDSKFGAFNGSCADSTTAAYKVTCFSNSAPFLTLFAPGAIINAASISMSGTSQATPHVAGAAAVLRAAYPTESVSQTMMRLKKGPAITDHRNGVLTPRLDLMAALPSTNTIAEILWQHQNGQVHYWAMKNGQRMGGYDTSSPVGPEWSLIGAGDVNGDGTDEILWQHQNGQVHYWAMKNGQRMGGYNTSSPVGSEWSLIGAGDVNGDGTDDILWQHQNGQVHYWMMKSGQRMGGYNIFSPVGPEWSLIGAGDVNSDGTDEILWQHQNGQVHYWAMKSGQRMGGYDIFSPVGPEWSLIGAGDVNGDGTDEILWQHQNGQVHYWAMKSGQRMGGYDISSPVGSEWSVIGAGDINGK
jgi:subtilisin family serine protease